MKRRSVALIALAMAMALIMSACGDDAATTTTTAAGTTAPETTTTAGPAVGFGGATSPLLTDDPITITYWRGCEGEGCTLEEQKVNDYQAAYPNVTVDWSEVAMFDAFDLMSVALPAGETVPTFGIQYQPWHPIFIEQGLLAPVMPECMRYGTMENVIAAYVPGALDAMTFDGVVYTLPMQQNSYSFFINNRLFEEAGLDPVADAPKTWEDVAALNDVLYKEENGQMVQRAFGFRHTAGPHWMAMTFTGLLFQAGGKVFNDDGTPAWNGPEGLQAMEAWRDVTVAPEISNNVQSSPYQDFADELDVMSFGGPNALEFMYQLNPALEGNVTVVRMPALEGGTDTFMSYGFNMWVNGNSSPADQCRAWNYIDFLLDSPNDFFAAIGMVQPKIDWYLEQAMQDIPGLDVAIEAIEKATPLPITTHWGAYQTAMANAVQRVVFEGADPQASLDQAVAEYNESIGG